MLGLEVEFLIWGFFLSLLDLELELGERDDSPYLFDDIGCYDECPSSHVISRVFEWLNEA